MCGQFCSGVKSADVSLLKLDKIKFLCWLARNAYLHIPAARKGKMP